MRGSGRTSWTMEARKEERELVRLRKAHGKGAGSLGLWVEVEVSHHEANMTRVQDPAKGFGHGIRWIDDASNVIHGYFAKCSPLLKSEVAEINVPRARSGKIDVDNLDSGIIVLIDHGGISLGVAEFNENHAEVLGHFGGSIGGNQFSLTSILG